MKLVVKTKFSLSEDSRSLSAPLPIVTLGSPLYIPVPSLNFQNSPYRSHLLSTKTIKTILTYYVACSVSGQDEPNPAL